MYSLGCLKCSRCIKLLSVVQVVPFVLCRLRCFTAFTLFGKLFLGGFFGVAGCQVVVVFSLSHGVFWLF